MNRSNDAPWPGEYIYEGFPMTGFDFEVTPGTEHPTLAVRWAGRELLCERSLREATNYPFAILKFSLAGLSVLESTSEKWVIEPGMAVWMLPRTKWQHNVFEDSKPVNQVVMVYGNEVPDLFEQHFGSAVGCTTIAHPHTVEAVMEQILVEGRMNSADMESNCAHLARVAINRIGADMAYGTRASSVAKRTYKRCRDFISTDFCGISSLSQVADACNVSVPYLCRLFEQFGETSPYDLLTRLRLQKAEMLLTAGGMPIAKVAGAVGYRDQGHFARTFRSAYGMSPTEFRRKSKP